MRSPPRLPVEEILPKPSGSPPAFVPSLDLRVFRAISSYPDLRINACPRGSTARFALGPGRSRPVAHALAARRPGTDGRGVVLDPAAAAVHGQPSSQDPARRRLGGFATRRDEPLLRAAR